MTGDDAHQRADSPAASPREVPEQGGHPAQRDDAEQTEIARLAARVAELEDNWRRALADADNMRKRLTRELDHERAVHNAQVASSWLPVLDNLDLALRHAEADPAAIVEGVRAVREQAAAVLATLGYPRQEDDVGTRFDPARHEAVATVPSANTPEGTVVDVVRPGYGDGARQLRPAAVVVAAKAPEGSTSPQGPQAQ